jgi:hypothetical protein
VRLKLLLASLASFVLLFAFQNCSKAPAGSSSGLNSSSSSHINVSNDLGSGQIYVDSRLANGGNYQDPANYTVENVSAIDFNFTQAGQFTYHLDLASGVLTDSSGHQQIVQPAQLTALNNLLTDGILSSVPLMADQPIECTEDYVDPYAQVTTNLAVHVLGQGSSGCPNEDLYNVSQQPLKPMIAAELQSLLSDGN